MATGSAKVEALPLEVFKERPETQRALFSPVQRSKRLEAAGHGGRSIREARRRANHRTRGTWVLVLVVVVLILLAVLFVTPAA